MSDCRVCATSIFWCTDPEGNRVPLDEHEQRDYGPGRYRLLTNTTPQKIEPVREESSLRTYVDHRVLCQAPRPI
jgi:hypothetical protein